MQNRNQRLLALIAFAMLSTTIVSVSASQKCYSQSQVTVNGTGATFPFPLIDTWRVAYQKVHPKVNINYQSIGSGEGVRQFAANPCTECTGWYSGLGLRFRCLCHCHSKYNEQWRF